jgi:hypothetical protein
MSEEMSERIANVVEFKAMKDDSKPFLGNGGSVGKHDTYPPSLDFAYADEERLPPAELVLRRERASTVTKGFIRFTLVPPQSTSVFVTW